MGGRARPVSAARHNAVLAAAQARVDRLEGRLAEVVRPILDHAGDQAARNFAARVTDHLTAAGDIPDWSAPFPDEIIDVDALVAELLAKTEPVRTAMVEQTMTPALAEAGLSWDVTNPLTAKALAAAGSQIRSIAVTTQLNVMRIVRASYDNGLSIPQTASAIREGMQAATPARATMIARTELGRAANSGSLAATQLVSSATGDHYDKTWRTAPGAPHPRHEDYDGLDGQTVGLEEQFEVGDAQLMYPGDPSGDPGDTINCLADAP